MQQVARSPHRHRASADARLMHCAAASSGVDFIWTEMQHARAWMVLAQMWDALCQGVPGARIPNANEFDEQRHGYGRASNGWIPTVRTVAEAQEAVEPITPRWADATWAARQANMPMCRAAIRNTINDNLVLRPLMIETLDNPSTPTRSRRRQASAVCRLSDLGNFAGYKQGDPDYRA